MTKKIVLFFYVLTLLSTSLFSQGPGYMGKHFSVAYGINTSPAFFNSNGKNRTMVGTEGNAKRSFLAFNIIHEGSVEYVISQRWSVGFCARYYKTTFDNPTLLVDQSRQAMFQSKKNPTGYYDITGLSYCLYFKLFNAKHVAPWGKYIVFGPVLNTAKMSYDPDIMHSQATAQDGNSYPYTYRDTLINNFGPQKQSYKGINLMLGFGRTRILYNRLILDYGFNVYLLSGFPNLVLTYKSNMTPETYIQKTVNRRVRGINHFNVFLKVGVLLF